MGANLFINLFLRLLFLFFLLRQDLPVAQAALKLWQSSCLRLPSVGIIGVTSCLPHLRSGLVIVSVS